MSANAGFASWCMAIVDAIDSAADDLISLSKYIHQHPEVAMQERQSSGACAEFLQTRGFDVRRSVAELPTAFRAETGSGGHCVAFLSEYDALPGVGHGCGHNLIAIAGIGAGIGLKSVLPCVAGRVRVYGTPAEEAIGGKAIMVEAGEFEGVDVGLGAHPGTHEAV
ncbi:MAG: amidohydrolase, partial [Chloroflexota bacterium]|nr:amidohydrolase [Chloroflexota bacterium]